MTTSDIKKKIRIFDTTLRDGEQTPGVTVSPDQKLEIAMKLDELTNKEIQSICDGRAAMVAEDKKNKKPLRVTLCPKKFLGAGATKLTRSVDAIFQKHLRETRDRLRTPDNNQSFSLFIFAHTHQAISSYSPFENSGSNWTPIVVNSGAWQRTISEEQLQKEMSDKNWRSEDVLKLQPENLPACYPVIKVEPYSSRTKIVLSGHLPFAT